MTDPARDHYVSRFAAFAEGLGDEAPSLAALRRDVVVARGVGHCAALPGSTSSQP